MFGILNLNKPAGITSRDLVNRVQRILRPTKVGHAGTLDPLATGVLVVCLGPATRLISYVQQMPKSYRATFLLGRSSDTDDIEGEILIDPRGDKPLPSTVLATLPQFTGEILQRPPNFSAIKVAGRRAYERARRGESLTLAARPVRIDRLTLVGYEYPELTIDIQCGSGTYVRSLGRDLAEQWGTSAVMSQLVRTAVGAFTLPTALAGDDITLEQVTAFLQSPLRAIPQLPVVELTAGEAERISRGLTINDRFSASGPEMTAVNERGELLAILVPRRDGLGPAKNFPFPR